MKKYHTKEESRKIYLDGIMLKKDICIQITEFCINHNIKIEDGCDFILDGIEVAILKSIAHMEEVRKQDNYVDIIKAIKRNNERNVERLLRGDFDEKEQ